jgi:hypothetical protein
VGGRLQLIIASFCLYHEAVQPHTFQYIHKIHLYLNLTNEDGDMSVRIQNFVCQIRSANIILLMLRKTKNTIMFVIICLYIYIIYIYIYIYIYICSYFFKKVLKNLREIKGETEDKKAIFLNFFFFFYKI